MMPFLSCRSATKDVSRLCFPTSRKKDQGRHRAICLPFDTDALHRPAMRAARYSPSTRWRRLIDASCEALRVVSISPSPILQASTRRNAKAIHAATSPGVRGCNSSRKRSHRDTCRSLERFRQSQSLYARIPTALRAHACAVPGGGACWLIAQRARAARETGRIHWPLHPPFSLLDR